MATKDGFTSLVTDFHRLIGSPIGTVEPDDWSRLQDRIRFLDEERMELHDACASAATSRNRAAGVDILDALVDIAYIAIGTAVELGYDFDEAFRRVHESNMTKKPPDSPYGKAVKDRDYVAPKLEDLV